MGLDGRRPHRHRTGLLLLILVAGLSSRPDARPGAQTLTPSVRVVENADTGWLFSHGDFANAAMPPFDDSSWERIDLPHDWSAAGPFSADLGSGNGYAPGGVAWYRRHFTVPAVLEGRIGTVEFDGAYDHAEVWINGHFVGGRPYGYSSFELPLTPHLRFGDTGNVLAVRVDHSRFADSRWYTGSGIYRHVRLRLTDPLHVAHWGTFVSTPVVTQDSATVWVETTIANASDAAREFVLETEVVFGGIVVARASTPGTIDAGDRAPITRTLTVTRPELWSPDSPSPYVLRERVRVGDAVVDNVETTFGIRSIRFDPDDGFFLNGLPLKLKGVCLHHDAGSVGAAVPVAVWERRLRTLKALGVNAIRTSHNPPAPELLDLADALGFLVKDEAFDEFTPAKNKWVEGWNAGVPSRFGYAESFEAWSVRDVEDMVRRDRNHPSVIMWSIGNEVDYPNDPFTHPVLGDRYRPWNPPAENLVAHARPLIDAIHALDATRPVTMALASAPMSDAVGLGAMLDVVGYNYQESRYAEDHATYPERFLFGSETGHSVESWAIVRDNDYVAGQFLWTGIDYLGEARAFPNRASGAGLLDLAGFRKPRAFLRESLWSSVPMVYAAAMPAAGPGRGGRGGGAGPQEHWNWPAGSTVRVQVYTNAAEVDLRLNGRSLGRKRADEAEAGVLDWEVPYEPGVLEARARANGALVAEFALRTAGPARRVELVRDDSAVLPGSERTLQVEYRLVDDRGVRVQDADVPVTFAIEGPGRLLGIGNGDLRDVDSPVDPIHRTWQGRGLLILQLGEEAGPVIVRASAPGLEPAELVVRR